VGLSALLTTTMPKMGETVNAIKEAGIRDQVKIMVGGAPVTASFAAEIGADGYASNAASAVEKGKELLGRR
jgi:5-methyltetrahydrofolate--homocysteine methyltransferase